MTGRAVRLPILARGETRALFARLSPADLGDDAGLRRSTPAAPAPTGRATR